MKRKRIIAVGCAVLMALNFAACKSKDKVETDTASIREKYESEEKVVYNKPQYNLERGYKFEYDTTAKVGSKLESQENGLFKVYIDTDLTQEIKPKLEYDSATEKVTVAPPDYPVLPTVDFLDSVGLDEVTAENIDDFDTSFKNKDWGNAGNYYLVQLVDTKTGEELKKPIVTVFTLKPELDTPTVNVHVDNDGVASLQWNEVNGAEKYIVYSVFEDADFSSTVLSIEDETVQTSYDDFLLSVVDYDGQIISMNGDFELDEDNQKMYCVMAISGDKKSLASNLIKPNDYSKMIPCEYAMDDTSDYSTPFNSIEELPTHLPVKMGDGSIVKYPLSYDIAGVEKVSTVEGNIPSIKIKANIEGTLFSWDLYVVNVDYDKLGESLKAIASRQDRIRGNALRSDIEIDVPNAPSADYEVDKEEEDTTTEELASPTDKIYASSALSEYLAINMLNNEERIKLKDYPEASNTTVLLDSMFEAYYQNPLIMKLERYKYDYATNELVLQYGQTKEELKKQQDEINAEVDKIIKEIIKKDMTPLEKETAINNYLCESSTYDTAALENAKANGMIPDKSFNSSFTPYGILVKKVGVCASYASSFKLLANKAGLESVVVTGNLNGNLPHAWNRVLIDKEWMTIDVTNNDNEYSPNGLFNIPDDVSKTVLVEDDRYALNSTIGNYLGKETDLEYYRLKDEYYSKESISDELAKKLNEDGVVYLRTDYDLTEEEFATILEETVTKGKITSLSEGTYWLGVIYLKK